MNNYADASMIRREVARLLKPPVRMPVSEAASKYVRIGTGGNDSRNWDVNTTPYMREPMNLLNSRKFTTVCFVGPARTGKTQALVDAWIGYIMAVDPGDTMIVHTSQDAARDFSRRRIDRMFRHSPDLSGLMSTWGHADNTFDKTMASGAILSIAWPTIRQLSSRDIKNIALTDYDRGNEDVDGEGDKYTLAQKRTETYLSSGMTMLESSPGYDWSVRKWKQQSPHELPPSPGIVKIYNRGDRRMLYWPCPDCAEWFIPEFKNLDWNKSSDPLASAKTAGLICRHCGSFIPHKRKRELNIVGNWLIEGQSINSWGEITGNPRESKIASFHISGVVAAFQTWESLVYKYLTAKRDFDSSGDEKALRATVLLDQGVPYKPQRKLKTRDANFLQKRAESWTKYSVPNGVRFLIMAIDVQSNRFVVQVMGYGLDKQRWIIDRFDITRSAKRNGEELAPHKYLEDWDEITPLLTQAYDLSDGSGRKMKVMIVGCDSGGLDGVTDKIYTYWGKLGGIPIPGTMARLNRKFVPLKGEHRLSGAHTKLSYPDTSDIKSRGASSGNVPLLLVNTNLYKDELENDLSRDQIGPGYIHIPDFLPANVIEEFTNEEKDAKGNWIATGRNESVDLINYADALGTLLTPPITKIDWSDPPKWAQEWATNSMIINESVDNDDKSKDHSQNESSNVNRRLNFKAK